MTCNRRTVFQMCVILMEADGEVSAHIGVTLCRRSDETGSIEEGSGRAVMPTACEIPSSGLTFITVNGTVIEHVAVNGLCGRRRREDNICMRSCIIV